MKRFIAYIAIVLILVIFALEGTVRIFGLSGHAIPTDVVDGNLLNKPNVKGTWIRGGLKEINSECRINKQGYNSTKDYQEFPEDKVRIAILGDSFIEGLQVDVESSIGRLLEEKMNQEVVVHEFGVSGANIEDYVLIHEKYVKDNYDYTFVYLADQDLYQFKPNNIGRPDKKIPDSWVRKIYGNLHFVRYLNINHGVGSKFREVLSKVTLSNSISKEETTSEEKYGEGLNTEAVGKLGDEIIILYEKDRLDTRFFNQYSIPHVKIDHELLPKNFGFDIHWNLNGRINCAESIKKYLQGKMSKKEVENE